MKLQAVQTAIQDLLGPERRHQAHQAVVALRSQVEIFLDQARHQAGVIQDKIATYDLNTIPVFQLAAIALVVLLFVALLAVKRRRSRRRRAPAPRQSTASSRAI